MAYLALNIEGWQTAAARYYANSVDNIARQTRLRPSEVRAVLNGEPPSARFVAAALTAYPMMFEELFDVIRPLCVPFVIAEGNFADELVEADIREAHANLA